MFIHSEKKQSLFIEPLNINPHQPLSTLINFINLYQLYQPSSPLPNTLLFPKGRIGRFCLAFRCPISAGSAFFIFCRLLYCYRQIFFGLFKFSSQNGYFLLHSNDKMPAFPKFTKVYCHMGCILFFIALPLTNFSKPK